MGYGKDDGNDTTDAITEDGYLLTSTLVRENREHSLAPVQISSPTPDSTVIVRTVSHG